MTIQSPKETFKRDWRIISWLTGSVNQRMKRRNKPQYKHIIRNILAYQLCNYYTGCEWKPCVSISDTARSDSAIHAEQEGESLPGLWDIELKLLNASIASFLSICILGLVFCSLCLFLSLSFFSALGIDYHTYTPLTVIFPSTSPLPLSLSLSLSPTLTTANLLLLLSLTSPLLPLPHLYLPPLIHTEGVLLSVLPKLPPFSILYSSLFSFLVNCCSPPSWRPSSILPYLLWLSVRPSPLPFLFTSFRSSFSALRDCWTTSIRIPLRSLLSVSQSGVFWTSYLIFQKILTIGTVNRGVTCPTQLFFRLANHQSLTPQWSGNHNKSHWGSLPAI